MEKRKQKQNTGRKGLSSTAILILVFIVGLSVLLYPSVSNYYNSVFASHAVANYDTALSQMDTSENERMLAEASAYNEKVADVGLMFINGEPQDGTYKSLLDIDESGMMGYIYIKKLQITLPIYHGTSEAVLASGTGHLEGSSLPVGGEDTHAIITGHRGLPSAKLFTDLDQMEKGDVFVINILGQTLTYMVDDIKIVSPSEADKIKIIPGEDHVTLVTCTPYGINSHRLLVRGVRTDTPSQLIVLADAMKLDPVIVSPLVAAPMLLILLILLLFGGRRRRKLTVEDIERLAKDGELQ